MFDQIFSFTKYLVIFGAWFLSLYVSEPSWPTTQATKQRRRLAPSKAQVLQCTLAATAKPPTKALPKASPSPSLRFACYSHASPWLVELGISRGEVLPSISEASPVPLGTTPINCTDHDSTQVYGCGPMEIDQLNGVELFDDPMWRSTVSW